MFRRAVDPDRLQVIGLVDRVLKRAVRFAPGFRQVVEWGRPDVIEGMFRAIRGEGAGFQAGGIAEGMQVGAGRAVRHR